MTELRDLVWMPVDEVASVLGVSPHKLDNHLHMVKPRLATLPSGQQRREVATVDMWKLAQAMRVPLPPSLPAAPEEVSTTPNPPPGPDDQRGQANVRTALGQKRSAV